MAARSTSEMGELERSAGGVFVLLVIARLVAAPTNPGNSGIGDHEGGSLRAISEVDTGLSKVGGAGRINHYRDAVEIRDRVLGPASRIEIHLVAQTGTTSRLHPHP